MKIHMNTESEISRQMMLEIFEILEEQKLITIEEKERMKNIVHFEWEQGLSETNF